MCPLSFQVHTHTCTHTQTHTHTSTHRHTSLEQSGLVCQTTGEMMDDMWCGDVGRKEIDQSCKIVEDGDSIYRLYKADREEGKSGRVLCWCRCAIAVLTMRRYKDRSLDVCTLEVEGDTKVMR
ncbi:Uncharacterized protein BM_BM9656 [Brugia malayi]|uniref:Bm9656 n=1 Tax=Brugia malayi TaxID=6279 RepID=A0A0H5SJK1_BRUMA|nr:Uncharacterized protein BM_BM9656 [Brugia malayi]CRZ23990.1 Bm9656 [Brugia malayi]VIO87079.1 Uncharacterized protein BM_BM9656 [Brugia malayi]